MSLVNISLTAQISYTKANVNNYEVGDLFQYFFWYPEGSTKTQRDVIDKYYSASEDTVYYVNHILKIHYNSSGYTYEDYVDTVLFTDLNSMVGNSGTVSYSEYTCNDSVIQYYSPAINMFPTKTEQYGIGIGKVYARYEYEDEISYDITYLDLTYYNKGDSVCGTYDQNFETVDINKIEQGFLNIYPNPANSYAIVEGLKLQVESIAVYDLTGKLVKCVSVKESIDSFKIEVSDLQSGIYLVKVGERIEKLVVE